MYCIIPIMFNFDFIQIVFNIISMPQNKKRQHPQSIAYLNNASLSPPFRYDL